MELITIKNVQQTDTITIKTSYIFLYNLIYPLWTRPFPFSSSVTPSERSPKGRTTSFDIRTYNNFSSNITHKKMENINYCSSHESEEGFMNTVEKTVEWKKSSKMIVIFAMLITFFFVTILFCFSYCFCVLFLTSSFLDIWGILGWVN